MRRCLIIVCLLLALGSVQAAEPNLRRALLAYQVAFTADIWSTERGLNRGFTESNPLSEARPTDGALALKYVAWSAIVWYAAEKVPPKHRRLAKGLLLAGTLIHVACAYHNEQLIRGDR